VCYFNVFIVDIMISFVVVVGRGGGGGVGYYCYYYYFCDGYYDI
jgi:hypothetical protein